MYLHTLFIFLFGLIGGIGAYLIGAPLPFMLGGIFGAAAFVIFYERDGRQLPKLSRWIRLIFMAIIGTMIGSRFSPDFLTILPQFWVSGLAIIPFILLAHGGSFAIMRGLGRYSKRDAFFASLPGGIIDSVAMAEAAGADLRIVTAQHFVRIILVVTTVPLLFLFIQGDAVGSLAGESIATSSYGYDDVLLILIIAMVGLIFGQVAKLPVSHMLGPLVLSLGLSMSGVVELNPPAWMINLAQYMVGTALGAQFSGVSRRMLAKGFGLGILVGAYMLLLGAGIAVLLSNYVPANFAAMFVSFAAGGLAEMSLIALSLNFNPVVVALHHLVRILLTVAIGSFLARSVFKLVPKR